jgi:signal transduction histidine kinase
MFRGLRLRLTLLYLSAALGLIVLVCGGTYIVLEAYFQRTTDQALRYRMAQEFVRRGAVLPPELAAADRDWYAHRVPLLSASASPNDSVPGMAAGGEHEEGEGETDQRSAEETYDGELAAIFVLSLSAEGQVGTVGTVRLPPLAPDQQAIAIALAQGSDWRTTRLADGTRVRLLTYRLMPGDNPMLLQLGRILADQDRALSRLLMGLLALASMSALLLGASSWWLAGRSLRPAEQAWERQQAFIANASHELRAPLTLLRASAEVAQRSLPGDDTDRRALLGDVLKECDHMRHLVDDLLLLSRLDAEGLPMERVRISVPDLLAEVQRQIGQLAAERGVQVTTGAVSGAAWGDPVRVRQVLLILLDNALRHTRPGGSVRLDAHTQGREVLLSVSDTGSGIAPTQLPHVFERFYRAGGLHQNSGSGLGLSIARAIVDAHQGHIAIDSQVGAGTQVIVTLPRAEL